MREVRGHHGLEGDTEGILERIDFKGNVGFFKEGPAELVRCHDYVGQAFVLIKGTIERDMGHGELSDFGFAPGFMINV